MHLQSLGLKQPQIAVVFLAGPLCGMFVQPAFGIWSDRCQSAFGRRRPFIVFGAFFLILSQLGLAFAEELAQKILQYRHGERDGNDSPDSSIFAIVFTCLIFFAIQPIQGGLRALSVDVCPASQQGTANAWASRTSSLAGVVTYLSASLDLTRYLAFLGNTQFKILSMLASATVGIAAAFVCIYVVEEELCERNMHLKLDNDIRFHTRLTASTISIPRAISRLPKQVYTVYAAQFFAWMGWFPYLFYSST